MDDLVAGRAGLLVRQVKEWGEILTGFETRNRYELLDAEGGGRVGYAAEEGGGLGAMMLRSFFGRCRAAIFHVYDEGGRELLRGEKPFRFYFHRVEVREEGRLLGAVQRRFAIFSRRYVVEDENGRELLAISSPFFRIWTFKLLLGEREVGRISKRWSGLLREAFTDADTFGVEFPEAALGDDLRKILVAATFLVDMAHFENNRRD